MKKIISVNLISLALLFNYANLVFAEPAPVYDVDAMPPQFDSADQPQADEMPPPPGDQDNTFVPIQPQAQERQSQTQPSPQTQLQVPQSLHASAGQAAGSIEERLERLEQQIYTLQDNTQSSDSSPRIDFLLSQVQSLRGQVEKLTNQLSEMQSQGKVGSTGAATIAPSVDKNVVANADKTIAKEEVTAKPLAPAQAVKTTAQPNVAEEQQIYQTAYNLIKQKKYGDAVNTLQSMLKRYPTGQFASNAHYWLGELYGVMGKNDQALTEFETVVKTYSDSPRVSDAQLKIGLILSSQFKWREAKLAFKKVINHYPGTTSSRLASEQLKQIKQAGH